MFPNFSGAPDRGSSPLARGLRDSELLGRRLRGIIPARAGFTVRRGIAGLRGRDHPRSRGVYASLAEAACALAGSSPLARGLHPLRRRRCRSARIIPARAGFTQAGDARFRRHQDHPRSRGVYAERIRKTKFGSGSSPLARGLRRTNSEDQVRLRIIPARAGFTVLGMCLFFRARDHPRSRGVYEMARPTVGPLPGSSPLARGLR